MEKAIITLALLLLLAVGCYGFMKDTVIDPAFIMGVQKHDAEWRTIIFRLIDSMNFQHAKIVKAIAVLESGNFTSELFYRNNNIFGMKRVRKRETTQMETATRYGKYESVESCVRDMKIYWDMYFSDLTEEQVYKKLQSVYAQDPRYSEKIRNIVKSL